MNNYNQKNLKSGLKTPFNTKITIKSMEDLSTSFGNELPFPQYHWITQSQWDLKTRYYYQFTIDGVFDTLRGVAFLNDIIARFMITFPNEGIEKQEIKRIPAKKEGLKLKQFQGLKSVKSLPKQFFKTNLFTNKDNVFWALKINFEIQLERGNISYETFEDFAFANFEDKAKDRSTLRAKCRSIYNYYLDRNFETRTRGKYKNHQHYLEETMATRQQNMAKINNKRKEDCRRVIVGLITGLTSFEYKKQNGEWNVSKLAKDTKLTRKTIYKYLEEFKSNL